MVAWLSWNGGACWQRIFDFGNSDAGEGAVGNAVTSVVATPLNCPGNGPTAGLELDGDIAGAVDGGVAFPVLENTPFAVVLDVAAGELRMDSGGVALGTTQLATLSRISDVS